MIGATWLRSGRIRALVLGRPGFGYLFHSLDKLCNLSKPCLLIYIIEMLRLILVIISTKILSYYSIPTGSQYMDLVTDFIFQTQKCVVTGFLKARRPVSPLVWLQWLFTLSKDSRTIISGMINGMCHTYYIYLCACKYIKHALPNTPQKWK